MKINSFKTLLLTAVLLPLFSGCDDFSLFGTDDYIDSFVVTKDGVDYTAGITDNVVTLNIPSNVDLSTGAKVKYGLCENAKITPDPSTITDWSIVQKFTVTSFDGNHSSEYTYQVMKNEVAETGTVILKTQKEVDAFALKKITQIDGSLMLGENTASSEDSIKDLSGLSNLNKVSGNLIIYNSYAGKDLKGLANLQSVGNVFIGATSAKALYTHLTDVTFPALVAAGQIVVNNDDVTNLSLPALTNAYSLFINCKILKTYSLSALNHIFGDFTFESGTNYSAVAANKELTVLELNALQSVGGSMTICGFATVEKIKMPALTNLVNILTVSSMGALTEIDMPALTNIKNSATFSTLPSLTTIGTPLERVGGTLTMTDLKAYTTASLSKLKTVGTFNYQGTGTTTFDFPALTTLDNLNVGYTGLTNLTFPALQKVGTKIQISNNEKLSSLSFPVLTDCPTIYFSEMYALESADISKVTNLTNLTMVSGYAVKSFKLPKKVQNIEINSGSNSTSFPVFENIETITGKLYLNNFNKLYPMVVPCVKSIGTFQQGPGEVSLTLQDVEKIGYVNLSNYNLNTFSAPKLASVDSINWTYLRSYKSIDLSSLKKVTGTLTLWGATYESGGASCKITDVNFFSALQSVGKVNIKWCPSLADFSGLKNALPSLSDNTWLISGCKYNPTYADMTSGKYISNSLHQNKKPSLQR